MRATVIRMIHPFCRALARAVRMTCGAETEVREMDVDVDGVRRSVTVVGEPGGDRPRGLLLVFHGSRQDGAGHRKFTGGAYERLTERGMVVAYLDGYRGNWNDARLESRFPARVEGMDDVGFTRAVIERLVSTRGVDPRRVVALGYSNGGQMVMRIAHEAPDLLAGAVVIAATMPAEENFLLPATPPASLPLVLVHGTKDPISHYAGGQMAPWARKMFKVGGRSLSMPETAAYFAARNGITAGPTRTAVPRDERSPRRTSVERTAYEQDGRDPVVLYVVHGGGHTVPGPRRAPFVLGATSADVLVTDLVAEVGALVS